MSPEEIEIVQSTWAEVAPIADMAASLFYDKLFETEPDLKPLFAHVDLDTQKRKLIDALTHVVGNLDNFEDIAPQISDLGRRHVAYGATPAHYFSVGAALLATLETGLGDHWTEDAASAWTEAYTAIAGLMQNAGEDVSEIAA